MKFMYMRQYFLNILSGFISHKLISITYGNGNKGHSLTDITNSFCDVSVEQFGAGVLADNNVPEQLK